MKVSREQFAENRRRILEAAGRLFRERGFEQVSVAEVMKAAGLTHGGFYGHFKSKEDLIAQALAHAVAPAPGSGEVDLAGYVSSYLTPGHRDDLGGGCVMAAVGADAARQSPEARAALTEGMRRHLEALSGGAPGMGPDEKRRAAIGAWAAMLGAMVLARMSSDPELSEEILRETRAFLADRACADA